MTEPFAESVALVTMFVHDQDDEAADLACAIVNDDDPNHPLAVLLSLAVMLAGCLSENMPSDEVDLWLESWGMAVALDEEASS